MRNNYHIQRRSLSIIIKVQEGVFQEVINHVLASSSFMTELYKRIIRPVRKVSML
jgi:hypothetical protein